MDILQGGLKLADPNLFCAMDRFNVSHSLTYLLYLLYLRTLSHLSRGKRCGTPLIDRQPIAGPRKVNKQIFN